MYFSPKIKNYQEYPQVMLLQMDKYISLVHNFFPNIALFFYYKQ